MVGDRPQRKDICRCTGLATTKRLRGEIDFGRIAKVIIDMVSAGGDRIDALASLGAGSDLPVHDLQPRLPGRSAMNEHILRGEATMIETLAVRMAKRLGKLSEQAQTRVGSQVGQLLAQESIKPYRVWIVLEHQRRPKLHLSEVQHPQDTWDDRYLRARETRASPCGQGVRAHPGRRHARMDRPGRGAPLQGS